MVREFNPDDLTTVGPRAANGGAPLPITTITYNMIRANIGENVAFSYSDWLAIAEKRSFWSRVEDNGRPLPLISEHPSFQGLDQSEDDPYYHYLITKDGDINKGLTNMTDKLCYMGGIRARLSGPLKQHLLQFTPDGQVVLNDAGKRVDRKTEWRYVLTAKPLALTRTDDELVLKTSVDETGALLLEYEDGETFNPRDAFFDQ